MASTPATEPQFAFERVVEDGRASIRLRGQLTLDQLRRPDMYSKLNQLLWPETNKASGSTMRFDLSDLESCDGAGAAVLIDLRGRVRTSGGEIEFVAPRPQVERILALYRCPSESPPLRERDRGLGLVEQVGFVTLDMIAILKQALAFLGDFMLALRAAIRKPSSVNWRDIVHLGERTGADGVPIVLVINFLIGAIMALQAAEQLRRFGAGIFVANLVGLSMVRELGPLMTAIIVAGRSGAAFAAELGTMRVSEEVDALETLGLDPQRYLVFPRLLALVLVMPMLVLLANFIGCLGGLFVAVTTFDLTSVAYLTQLGSALDLWDLGGGLFKGVVFAAVITLIACQKGLSTRGGAEGVGVSTTSAVVTILFSLVALDALFTILFNLFGI